MIDESHLRPPTAHDSDSAQQISRRVSPYYFGDPANDVDIACVYPLPDILSMSLKDYDHMSPEEKVQHILEYTRLRREEIFHTMQYGKEMSVHTSLEHFHAIRQLEHAESSHYIKRLLEWTILREVHEHFNYGDFEVDRHSTPPDVLKQYDAYWDDYKGELPQGVIYTYQPEDSGTNTQSPEDYEYGDYAAAAMSKYPWLADPDYFPPSPYALLMSQNQIVQIDTGDTTEIAIETSALFGIDYNSLSPRARANIDHYGLRLTDSEYGHIAHIVGRMDQTAKNAFAEGFLVAQYGSTLTEQLIALGDDYTLENSATFTDSLRLVCASLDNFSACTADFFTTVDTDWASSLEGAVNTRLSEAVYEIHHAMQSTSASEHRKLLGTLEYIRDWTTGLRKMLLESTPQIEQRIGNTTLIGFVHPKDGLLPGMVEISKYGITTDTSAEEANVREGRGARISFTYGKDAGARSLDGKTRRNYPNGRFDKATKDNPDAPWAPVSFDLFSQHVRDPHVQRAADFIERGNRRHTGKRGNYTYGLFDEKWGNREMFADLATKVETTLLSKISQHGRLSMGHAALKNVA